MTGGNSQAGVGRIQVVDVTTPTTAHVIRELDIPGTVITLGVGVSGNVGVVIGSTRGFQDNPAGVIIGNLTVTTLDGAAERQASGASPAFNRIDLLSVLMHELGHLLGKADLADASAHSLMLSALPVGTRRLPEPFTPTALVPQDINRDGVVSPLDALLIINQLNHRVGQSTLVAWSEFDVNKDGYVSPLDAMLVINVLNQPRLRSHGEGEGGPPESTRSQTESSTKLIASDNDWLDSLAADVIASRNHLRRRTATNFVRTP